MKKTWILICMITGMTGCTLAGVKVEMLSERTALENQVLGAYNSLDAQMLLTASVRGVDTTGAITRPPAHSREFADTISAMQTLDFHNDDLERFKAMGWVGENNQGLVEVLGVDRAAVPDALKEFAARYSDAEFAFVVSKINAARENIMARVIHMNENLTDADLPEVRKIFAKFHAENSRPGEKIQDPDGTWRTKKDAS